MVFGDPSLPSSQSASFPNKVVFLASKQRKVYGRVCIGYMHTHTKKHMGGFA